MGPRNIRGLFTLKVMQKANETVGLMIRRYRKEKRMMQKDLAERVGLSRCTITNIEKGYAGTNLENLYAIADALGITIHDLIPVKNKPRYRLRVNRQLSI